MRYLDHDQPANEAPWDNWETVQDEIMITPKLEPNDSGVKVGDITAAQLTPVQQIAPQHDSEAKQKRQRGRPRKHPLPQVVNTNKVTDGRSKTGCITCRKRKKKCDEAKPHCLNCEKNVVICEGYNDQKIRRNGKEKAEEEPMQPESLLVITMLPIFHGVETAEDKILWKYYINRLSNVLTVEGESKNAFKDIILQLANQNQGLMHSILSVSSKHIDFDSTCGAKILQDNPATTRDSLKQRGDFHYEEALRRLYKGMQNPVANDDPAHDSVLAAQYGQMLCLLLETRAEGSRNGEHRAHLQAYQALVQHSLPVNDTFNAFITEFFQYHIYADDLLWHSGANSSRLLLESWESQTQIQPPRLMGVEDGLFHCLSHITTLRNIIRENMAASIDPIVDCTSLYRAAEIDAAIREWTPKWPPGDSRHRVALQTNDVGISVPDNIPAITSAMAPFYLCDIACNLSTAQCRQPPTTGFKGRQCCSSSTTSMMLSSNDSVLGCYLAHGCTALRNPPCTNSIYEQDSTQPTLEGYQGHKLSSHAPARRLAQDDRRITLAVEESLAILETFEPSDPAQTLLLIPCTVIGAACFDTTQRNRTRTAIRVIRGYTGLRSCDRVAELLEEVWSLMDHGDWVSVWDWQVVAKTMGLDFLCA